MFFFANDLNHCILHREVTMKNDIACQHNVKHYVKFVDAQGKTSGYINFIDCMKIIKKYPP